MNFRLRKGFTRTYAAPDAVGCMNSMRPIIHCFTTRPFVVNKTGKDVRIWFVGIGIPQLIDDGTRKAFYKKNGAFTTGGNNRLIRSFAYQGGKFQVFYTRAPAVRAFEKLVAHHRGDA